MSAADRLKIVRDALKKGQKEMATLLGIKYRTYQNYEAGLNPPGWETVEALTYLGFNANWLLTGEGEMKRGNDVAQSAVQAGLQAAGQVTVNGSLHQDIYNAHEPTTSYTGAMDRRHPSMAQATDLLRLVIDCYVRINAQHGLDHDRMSKQIPLIYRHFYDNYEPSVDEVEISEYIEKWF